MFFLANQYRVLKAISLFGFGFIADMKPTFTEVKVRFMKRDTVVRHIYALQKLGCVTISSLGDNRYIGVTQRGIEYFFELKRTIVSGLLSFLSAIFLALFGYFLGLHEAPSQQIPDQRICNCDECCHDTKSGIESIFEQSEPHVAVKFEIFKF